VPGYFNGPCTSRSSGARGSGHCSRRLWKYYARVAADQSERDAPASTAIHAILYVFIRGAAFISSTNEGAGCIASFALRHRAFCRLCASSVPCNPAVRRVRLDSLDLSHAARQLPLREPPAAVRAMSEYSGTLQTSVFNRSRSFASATPCAMSIVVSVDRRSQETASGVTTSAETTHSFRRITNGVA
jgi:hypothetical protein